MRIINQALRFKKLPSEILKIKDEYTAFCFDEACMYIITQIEDKKKPLWDEDRKKNPKNKKDKYYLNDYFREQVKKNKK